jgi:hypothetical protein
MCLAHEDEIFEILQTYLGRTDEMTTQCDPGTIAAPDKTVARLTIFREQSEAYALFSAVLHTRKDELTALRGEDADAMMNLLHRVSSFDSCSSTIVIFSLEIESISSWR